MVLRDNKKIQMTKNVMNKCLSFHCECGCLCLQFGDSQKLRLVRILRSTVMVRVGGGWVALDEFLVKNDPCRGKLLFTVTFSFHAVFSFHCCQEYFFGLFFSPYVCMHLETLLPKKKKIFSIQNRDQLTDQLTFILPT